MTDLRHVFRNGDEASGTMLNFVVGTATFLVSISILLHFTAEPPRGTSGIEHQELKSQANNALSILLGTGGYPATWATDAQSVDALERIGLLDAGSSVRINTAKFDALARGSYSHPSADNGLVDYAEAREALGLHGYDFHLRAFPIVEPFGDDTYAVEGMETFRVAYVGHFTGGGSTESPASIAERNSLDQFDLDFNNVLRTSSNSGDVYKDVGFHLRSFLVPRLGSDPDTTVLNAGSGVKYDFRTVDPAQYVGAMTAPPSPATRALALTNDDGELGYSRNRELRATLGVANLTGVMSSFTLTWDEFVDTKGGALLADAGDYGYFEVSSDGGATWVALTDGALARSVDTNGLWTPRTHTISSNASCGCMNMPEVLVAARWLADNDHQTGKGWVMDDVKFGSPVFTGFFKTFEKPHYDLLVIGSDVAQEAFVPAEVKQAIRDYVTLYGGRLVVLGGQTNTQWLQPLFHVGIHEAGPGVSSPDETHPLLTVPNELDWKSFNHNNKAWKFGSSSHENLFQMVTGDSTGHMLSISGRGAFGTDDQGGAVMLTTYLPGEMDQDMRARFFANALTYGRFHRLYIEVGPPVPEGIPVATASRSLVMDKHATTDENFIEMAFVIYIWPGDSTGAGSAGGGGAPLQVAPGQTRHLVATADDSRVDLSWQAPLSLGTGTFVGYDVYRGTNNGSEAYLHTVAAGQPLTYADLSATNGTTYYYNVTARSSAGTGSSSNHVSATPSGAASAPTGTSASGTLVAIMLSWSPPLHDGGSAITGYTLYRGSSPATLAAIADVGATTSYLDEDVVSGTVYHYAVAAINSRGESQASSTFSGSTTSLPPEPTALVAAPLVGGKVELAWVAPVTSDPILHYRVYRGTSSGAITTLVAEPATTLHADSPPLALTLYYYQVSAVTDAGEGPRSMVASSVRGT